ncbi:MAG: sigma-54-dependent Fis family transcriptional regulator [Planctomycetes bacterium]|nr:sigma-54-dependent Fis family transcriptional regulator [Planctomycetota bacterium]
MTAPDRFKVLVVDDEKLSRLTTKQQLIAADYDADCVSDPFQALSRLENENWDLVLTDLRMSGMDGIEFLKRIKQEHPVVEVILMTAFGTVETAVMAMRWGATDYLTKPFKFQELDIRLKRIAEYNRTREELKLLREIVGDPQENFGLIGESPKMREVREKIASFADHPVPVLITGQTGTGKEVVARALHRQSRRNKYEFVAIGCGNIPRELAESELFGHEKGAFTGASSTRPGSFERADKGTLLLDDIDDLPLEIQVKLLRVLQEGVVCPVGGVREKKVDVRVMATTKVDLEEAVAQKKFRPDLFYRLRGLEINLPPLANRGDDVLTLADLFLKKCATLEGRPNKFLEPAAAQLLLRYSWPGNVRELRRAMESAFVLANGSDIKPQSLPEFLQRDQTQHGAFTLNLDNVSSVNFPELIQSFEVQLLQWGLQRGGGSQSKAARALGLPRTTLQSKLGHL